MTAKVRTNVYLDSEMKAKAQEIFIYLCSGACVLNI